MEYTELQTLVRKSKNIVFFGGAGTSTESGIPDFRSAEGLFHTNHGEYSPEEILSHDFFFEHSADFYSFYKAKMVYRDAKPNQGHLALSEWEKEGKLRAIITQNIDGLHQLAGSRNVLELHGSIHRNTCLHCGETFSLDDIVNSKEIIPSCSLCNGIVKPDVVLYQEQLDMELFQEAIDYISQADVLIVAGTSLSVYPAAGLVKNFQGNHLILINKAPTSYDNGADYVIRENIGSFLHHLAFE
ncbi:NAD-dependent protein deacylase [Brevibacillus daliensis]|uniref:NAD-dependent protein deacylase n=1 Tax=Brevibacillus daliensis TaxID=2892995 RepID=UPI001E40557A|nr:NAD-dependent protein deacylase [Brevibacillus daliensis]